MSKHTTIVMIAGCQLDHTIPAYPPMRALPPASFAVAPLLCHPRLRLSFTSR